MTRCTRRVGSGQRRRGAMRALAVALAFVAVSSCGRSAPPVEPERVPARVPPPTPAPGAAAGASAVLDAVERLLLERHDRAQAEARYLPVDLRGGALASAKLGTPRTRPAIHEPRWGTRMPDGSWGPAYRTVVASEGDRFARAEATPAGPDAFRYRLVVERLDGSGGASALASVDRGDAAPWALELAGQTLLVGGDGRLDHVELDAVPPAVRELVVRTGTFRKPYDLFVRQGEHLLAIDDQVAPRFADWLRLDARGRPTRVADLSLPGMINGVYAAAAITPDGADAWTIHALLPFGIITGAGQTLATLHLRGSVLEPGGDVVLNGGGGRAGVVEEFEPRGTHGTRHLVAGETMTTWSAIAAPPEPPVVLVAAGARGLLVFPRVLEPTTRPAVLELGGDCRDVLLRGRRIVALVGSGESAALVELRASATAPAGLEVAGRLALPASYDRFVR